LVAGREGREFITGMAWPRARKMGDAMHFNIDPALIHTFDNATGLRT